MTLADVHNKPRQDYGVRSPFVGTRPFLKEDSVFFFGRDREAARLANLIVASTMAVLYGESGVGKSSLLNARLPDTLEELEPDWTIITFFEWQSGFFSRLTDKVASELTSESRTANAVDDLAKQLLTLSSSTNGPVLLVLDQFEEYFLYNPGSNQKFEAEIAKLVNRRMGDVRVLFCLRSDQLFLLDRLRLRVPEIFGRIMLLEPLTPEAAVDCVVKPILAFNADAKVPVVVPSRTSDLVQALVLGAVEQEIRRRLPDVALGEVEQSRDQKRVVAPFLQMALDELWQKDIVETQRSQLSLLSLRELAEMKPEEPSIQAVGLLAQKYVDSILRSFSDEEKSVCVSIFERMVLPSGQKVAVRMNDLLHFIPEEQHAIAKSIFSKLSKGDVDRLIKTVASSQGDAAPQFQIVHDALATPILLWVNSWRGAQRALAAERKLAETEKAAHDKTLAQVRAVIVKSIKLGIKLGSVLAIGIVVASVVYLGISARHQVKNLTDIMKRDITAGEVRLPLLLGISALSIAKQYWWVPVDVSNLRDDLVSLLNKSPRDGGSFASFSFDPEGSRYAWLDLESNAVFVCSLAQTNTCEEPKQGSKLDHLEHFTVRSDLVKQTSEVPQFSQNGLYSVGFLKDFDEPAIYHSGMLHIFESGSWQSYDLGKLLGLEGKEGFINGDIVDGALRITINNWVATKLWITRLDVSPASNPVTSSNDVRWNEVRWSAGNPAPTLAPNASGAAYFSVDQESIKENTASILLSVSGKAPIKVGSTQVGRQPFALGALGYTYDNKFIAAMTQAGASILPKDNHIEAWTVPPNDGLKAYLSFREGSPWANPALGVTVIDSNAHTSRLAWQSGGAIIVAENQTRGPLVETHQLLSGSEMRNINLLQFSNDGHFLFAQSIQFGQNPKINARIWDIQKDLDASSGKYEKEDAGIKASACRIAAIGSSRKDEDGAGNQFTALEMLEFGISSQPCPVVGRSPQ